MSDANGNALLSAGEWIAVSSVFFGTGLIILVALVATVFPKHWS